MTAFNSAGWGQGFWGTSAWAINLNTTGNPIITYRLPAQNQLDVEEYTSVTVHFFDPAYDLDTSSAQIYINGVLAYSGTSGFSAGFAGKTAYISGVLIVEVFKQNGYYFDETVTVTAYIADTDVPTKYVMDTWNFTIKANPACYSGVQPLAIETQLLSSFTRFTALEYYRKEFLNNALILSNKSIRNQSNKAARVVYEIAFATELSVVLNQYNLRDETALEANVCEKQKTLLIDRAVVKNPDSIRTVIGTLAGSGLLPAVYTTQFYDYLDSSLYLYRISLIANLLLLAKAIENGNGS